MKRFLIGLVVVLVAGGAVAKLFVFELPTVTGNDMAPTLQAGDRLLVYRLNTEPARGQLALIEHPQIPKRLLIRRVVALPGETFALRKEVPVVGGKRASRKVLSDVELEDLVEGKMQRLKMKLVEESIGGATYQLLKDPSRRSRNKKVIRLFSAYYVLSDNRNHGTDSREFGPVPSDRIRGVVTHRISAGAGTVTPKTRRDEGFVPLEP